MNRPGQSRPLQSSTNIANQNSQPRNTANTRMQSSKMNSWAQVGLPGLQTGSAQSRENNSLAPDNWAQAMGSRPNPQLDLSSSSFPSLNNAGLQSQSHNIGSSAWQTGPPQAEQVQRQQLQNSRAQLSSRQQQQQSAGRDGFYPSDTFSRNVPMDFVGDQSSQSARRGGAATNGPPGLLQRQSNQIGDGLSNDLNRVTSPIGLGQSSRSPVSQGLNGAIGQDRPLAASLAQTGNDQHRRPHGNDFLQHSPQTIQQLSRDAFSERDSFDQTQPSHQEQLESLFENMSEKDKWGMKGYVALQDGPNGVMRSLIRGQDLSTLGLNMNSEGSLLSTYAGPFARPNAHPLRPLDTEFSIPDCYTVKKIAPLQSRINGFMDETLFYIFYSMPRDYMQVLVAQELVERKWRYHMREQMWMTRDETTSNPVLLEDKVSEQGYYIWWDKNQWKKVRRPYTLRYEDLDDQPQLARRTLQPQQGAGGGGGNATAGAAGTSSNGGIALMGDSSAVAANGIAGGGSGGNFNAVPGLENMAAGVRGF